MTKQLSQILPAFKNTLVAADGSTITDLSEINTYYKTMLDSKTVLGNDPTSYITYHVTVTNLSNKEKRFIFSFIRFSIFLDLALSILQ